MKNFNATQLNPEVESFLLDITNNNEASIKAKLMNEYNIGDIVTISLPAGQSLSCEVKMVEYGSAGSSAIDFQKITFKKIQ